jgi:hypothetical protein
MYRDGIFFCKPLFRQDKSSFSKGDEEKEILLFLKYLIRTRPPLKKEVADGRSQRIELATKKWTIS